MSDWANHLPSEWLAKSPNPEFRRTERLDRCEPNAGVATSEILARRLRNLFPAQAHDQTPDVFQSVLDQLASKNAKGVGGTTDQ